MHIWDPTGMPAPSAVLGKHQQANSLPQECILKCAAASTPKPR